MTTKRQRKFFLAMLFGVAIIAFQLAAFSYDVSWRYDLGRVLDRLVDCVSMDHCRSIKRGWFNAYVFWIGVSFIFVGWIGAYTKIFLNLGTWVETGGKETK